MPNLIYEKDNYQIIDYGDHFTLKGTPNTYTYHYGQTPNRTHLYIYLMILGAATALTLFHSYAAIAALTLLHLHHLPKYYTTKQTPKREALDEALNQLEHHHQSEKDFQNYLEAVADTTNALLPNTEDYIYDIEFKFTSIREYSTETTTAKLSGHDLYLDTDGKIKNKYPITIITPESSRAEPDEHFWEVSRVTLSHEDNCIVNLRPNLDTAERYRVLEYAEYTFGPGQIQFSLDRLGSEFTLTTNE